MAAPYSLDLRQKVISQYNTGELTQDEVSRLFGIGLSTFKRWRSMYETTGNLEPVIEKTGRPSKIDQDGFSIIEKAVTLNNTITLDDLSNLYFKKRKIRVGRSILWLSRRSVDPRKLAA